MTCPGWIRGCHGETKVHGSNPGLTVFSTGSEVRIAWDGLIQTCWFQRWNQIYLFYFILWDISSVRRRRMGCEIPDLSINIKSEIEPGRGLFDAGDGWRLSFGAIPEFISDCFFFISHIQTIGEIILTHSNFPLYLKLIMKWIFSWLIWKISLPEYQWIKELVLTGKAESNPQSYASDNGASVTWTSV